MKILVTGANGLLGSHIVRELLSRHYKVRVIVRPNSNLNALEGLELEYFKGQVTKKKDVEKAVAGCHIVIHAAARTSPKPSHLKAFEEININSTHFITEACVKQGVKRLIYVSTANCMGNGTKKDPGDEQRPFMPWLKKSGYAYSKYLTQQHVLAETKSGKLDAVVVNPTFIIGEYDVKPGSGQIFYHILNKWISLYPPGGKNFVYAGAAAYGVVNAMEKGIPGECYLLAGENLSYRDFFQLSSNVAGQSPYLLPIPCFVLKFMGCLGDFSEKVLKRPVRLTSVNARMLCMENYYSPAKAEKELDFPLVAVEIAVQKSLSWFRANHYF